MKNIHVLTTDKPSRLVYNSTTNKFDLYSIVVFSSQCQNIYITNDEEIKEGDWVFGGDFLDVEKVCQEEVDNLKLYKDSDFTVPFKKIILTTDPDLIKDGVQAIDDDFLEWFVKNPSCEEVEVDKEPFDITEKGEWLYEYKIIIPRNTQQVIDEDFDGGLTMGQIIPQEEPKQETLEEAAERMYPKNIVSDGYDTNFLGRVGLYLGAKWQQEQDKLSEDNIRLDERCKCELENITTFSEGYDAGISQQERSYSEEDMREAFIAGGNSQIEEDDAYGSAYFEYMEEWFEQFKNK